MHLLGGARNFAMHRFYQANVLQILYLNFVFGPRKSRCIDFMKQMYCKPYILLSYLIVLSYLISYLIPDGGPEPAILSIGILSYLAHL